MYLHGVYKDEPGDGHQIIYNFLKLICKPQKFNK